MQSHLAAFEGQSDAQAMHQRDTAPTRLGAAQKSLEKVIMVRAAELSIGAVQSGTLTPSADPVT
ncbi:MAG TPA: hypothetical protein VKA67_05055 [Verrucomicrobiae bacterium]|nr:hypothetical protein [Verrucomicrobiae bacterium]